MLEFLWCVPVFPLAGFLVLVLFGKRLSEKMVAAIGAGSVGLSMVVSFLVTADFIVCASALTSQHPVLHVPSFSYSQTLWTWLRVDGLATTLGLYLDGLSLAMVLVVSGVSLLIHLYSIGFMSGDEGYPRFFAYMNLFVGCMLLLVLADNLLLLYLGWEGVGVCSYLLIGFWYREAANGKAAIKAFVVTRIGDTALAIGLFVLFAGLGSLDIREIGERAVQAWPSGSLMVVAAAALLLGGAVGKSAQLPLQTWLPDAMAGPTPVSALIHAATMVTAGVYLIARMNVIFTLAPPVMHAVALIGVLTLLMAGVSALYQRDIKRVLAYSTMSQVGYMFLALGVGAWSAAIFHFMTHAFFKALLFLAAGVVIQALDNEHDIFRMGGLRRRLPLAFWSFLVGAGSLSALPFVTAGFYSKDMILLGSWSSPTGGPWLWAAGTIGAALTSLYAFRVVLVAFFGEEKAPVRGKAPPLMAMPLIILSVFSLGAGFLEYPRSLGVTSFVDLIRSSMHETAHVPGDSLVGVFLTICTSLASVAGVLAAFLLYRTLPDSTAALERNHICSAFGRFWSSGWGFDRLYDGLFVAPYTWIARLDKNDVVDLFYEGLARGAVVTSRVLSTSQSGLVRWYVMALAIGAVVFMGIVVFL